MKSVQNVLNSIQFNCCLGIKIISLTLKPASALVFIAVNKSTSILTPIMQLVVEFADVRVLAFGVLNRPGTILLNSNSHAFLHPAGIEREIVLDANRDTRKFVGSSKKRRERADISSALYQHPSS